LLVFKRDKAGAGDKPEGPGFVGIAIRVSADRKAVVITGASKGSPAQKAGLKKGDVILKVGNEKAADLPSVVRLVRQARAGSDLVFRIRRAGKEQDITVKTGIVPFFLFD
jgi:S1-C subfamily serine protease